MLGGGRLRPQAVRRARFMNQGDRRGAAWPNQARRLGQTKARGVSWPHRVLKGESHEDDDERVGRLGPGSRFPFVKMLLDHGAKIKALDDSGRSPIIVASISGRSAEIVKLLLVSGANVRLQ